MGLTLLAYASMPLKLWGEAFLTVVHLINCLPVPNLKNLSPMETLFGHKPDYQALKRFGCTCYPFTRPYNKHKMDFRSE